MTMDDRPVGTVTPPPRTPHLHADAELDSGESTPRPGSFNARGSFYMAPRLAASALPVPISPGLGSVPLRQYKAFEGHEELLPEAFVHASGRLQGLGSGGSSNRYNVAQQKAPNPPTMVAPVAISAVTLSLVNPEAYRDRVQLTQTQLELDPLETHLAHIPQLLYIQRIWRGCTARHARARLPRRAAQSHRRSLLAPLAPLALRATPHPPACRPPAPPHTLARGCVRTQVRQFIEYNYAKPCLSEARKHAFRQVRKREDGRPFPLNTPLKDFRAFGEAVDACMHLTSP